MENENFYHVPPMASAPGEIAISSQPLFTCRGFSTSGSWPHTKWCLQFPHKKSNPFGLQVEIFNNDDFLQFVCLNIIVKLIIF